MYNLKSITPRFGLSGEISKKKKTKKKKNTSSDQCKTKAERYIKIRYNLSLKIFTDGSKNASKEQTRCAFAIPALNVHQMFKLNKNLTVYTSELIAILKALEWINENKPGNTNRFPQLSAKYTVWEKSHAAGFIRSSTLSDT